MYKKQVIGMVGEDLACRYLMCENYNIIERNFKCRQGEIDIIAFDNISKELVFIEVKTRTNFKYGIPAEAVTIQKQKHMRNSIKYYLYLKKCENVFIRIDVIEIVACLKKYKLNHIKGIMC